MAKLTKIQAKRHNEAMDLVNSKAPLTDEEKRFVLKHYNPNANSITTTTGAFFTPEPIAFEFAVFANPNGRVVDLCAGIGALSYEIIRMDEACPGKPNANISELICVEINEEYARVGQRIVPEARWVVGSVLDENLVRSLGPCDCVISNPPFGNIFTSDNIRWLKYNNRSKFDLLVIAAATEISDNGCFIIPEGKSNYDMKNRKYMMNSDFLSKTGFYLWPWGVDLTEYKRLWMEAAPDVEFVSMERKGTKEYQMSFQLN